VAVVSAASRSEEERCATSWSLLGAVGIPARNLTLIDRHATYAHNDPAGTYPRNVFFSHLIPFLRRIGGR
jgi:hypothetical protein